MLGLKLIHVIVQIYVYVLYKFDRGHLDKRPQYFQHDTICGPWRAEYKDMSFKFGMIFLIMCNMN